MAKKDTPQNGSYEIETVTGSSTRYRVVKGGKWTAWKTIQGTTLHAERAAAKDGAKVRFS